jgi:hypothetical protein
VAIASTVAAVSAGGALAATVSAAVQGTSAPASTTSSCTADPLQVAYAVQYSATLAGDAVTGVTISDTAPSPDLARCAGAGYLVTLRDAAGRSLGTVRGTVPPAVYEFDSAPFTAPVAASRVMQATLALGG